MPEMNGKLSLLFTQVVIALGNIPSRCLDGITQQEKNMEDPRKTGLKNGLRQLTVEQLQKVLAYDKPMVLDTYNYEDGKFCPLAVGVGLETMPEPTHEKVFNALTEMGYKVYNTRGIAGEFYTSNRSQDLFDAAQEVLDEKFSHTCRSAMILPDAVLALEADDD